MDLNIFVKVLSRFWNSNLQQLCSSIRQAEFSENSKLKLVAYRGSFSTIESVSSLNLIRVPELLQPANHLFYYLQTGH